MTSHTATSGPRDSTHRAPTPRQLSTWTRRALLSVTTFGAVSAMLGMWLALAGGGEFPTESLERTPFSSTVVPGLILGLVVGGTQAAAAWAVLRRWRSSLLLAGIAGCAMVIWIFAELAMLMLYSHLQTLYLGVGLAEVVMVIALLGVAPRVVAPWDVATDPTRPSDS